MLLVLRQTAQQQLGIGDDGGQGIADLMGNAGRQLTDGRHARRLGNIHLRSAQFFFHLFAGGDVLADADDFDRVTHPIQRKDGFNITQPAPLAGSILQTVFDGQSLQGRLFEVVLVMLPDAFAVFHMYTVENLMEGDGFGFFDRVPQQILDFGTDVAQLIFPQVDDVDDMRDGFQNAFDEMLALSQRFLFLLGQGNVAHHIHRADQLIAIFAAV
ncbi:hypothetical protein AC812_03035 [Bellilinea caldifistulae]|uniref:Uncharacterized protein n=1 Tax=Bellilinea caldifistulae TaxID=360411 RepID=A0A0P6X6F6_9CHLR|nr:hypothetical protein AC812_03035 [Bellilinea caldifistulae]